MSGKYLAILAKEKVQSLGLRENWGQNKREKEHAQLIFVALSDLALSTAILCWVIFPTTIAAPSAGCFMFKLRSMIHV